MDWQTPLRSQQTEFIKRLKLGPENLLFCQAENHFSELVVISEETLKHIRNTSWLLTERHKSTDSVREVFLRNLASKLGEEAVRQQMDYLLAEGSHRDLLRKSGKTKFNARQWKFFITYIRAYQYLNQFLPVDLFPAGCLRLAEDPATSIQIKTCSEATGPVQWFFNQEEIEKNVAVVCILIRESITEAQPKYHLVMAGFLPTSLIELKEQPMRLELEDLLYMGGLRSFLQFIQSQPAVPDPEAHLENSARVVSSETCGTINIGSWHQPLSVEQLIRLETAIQQLLSQSESAQSVPKLSLALNKQNPTLAPIWNAVLNQLTPHSTQSLLRQQSCLLSFDGERVQIGISSEALFAVGPKWLMKVEEAFVRLLGREVEVSVEVISS